MPHDAPGMTLRWFAEAVGGTLHNAPPADLAIRQVTQDTRQLVPGGLYVALRGDRYDGHDFADQAAGCGAMAALVERPLDVALPQIVVADSLLGLQQAAQAWRARFTLPLLAITGSNGKTTVKQMLAAMCDQAGPTLATEGNLNNHIGVPLTLLRLRADHRFAVIEMGASKPGDIAELAAIAQPTAGVITQAASAHLDGFGTLAGVAAGKGELFSGLPDDATAVLNADDCFAATWGEMIGGRRTIRFGARADAAVHPASAEQGQLRVQTPIGVVETRLTLPGAHNVMNALAAIGLGVAAGLTPTQMAAGLASMKPAAGRLTVQDLGRGLRLIDDSYNANPASAAAAINVLASQQGERWLVLGEMRELGADSDALHQSTGALASERGVDRLFCVGEPTRTAADGFGAGAHWFADQAALQDRLSADMAHRDKTALTILLKGSRGARLEQTAEVLRQGASAGQPAADGLGARRMEIAR